MKIKLTQCVICERKRKQFAKCASCEIIMCNKCINGQLTRLIYKVPENGGLVNYRANFCSYECVMDLVRIRDCSPNKQKWYLKDDRDIKIPKIFNLQKREFEEFKLCEKKKVMALWQNCVGKLTKDLLYIVVSYMFPGTPPRRPRY